MIQKEIDNQKVIRGICSFLILFVHLGRFTRRSFIFNAFNPLGYLCVGIFFLYSGYNLINSFLHKDNYFQNFWLKKVVRIYIPLVISNILFVLIAIFCNKATFSTSEILKYIFGILCINDNNWYFYAILCFYLSAWLILKIFKNIYPNRLKGSILILGIFFLYSFNYYSVAMPLHLTTRIANVFALPLLIGMFYALFKDEIHKVLDNSLVYEIVLTLSIGGTMMLHYANMNNYSFLLFDVELINLLAPTLLVIAIILISYKVNLKSCIFKYINSISLELYVYHAVILTLFANAKFTISNCYIYLLTYLIVVFLLAHTTNRLLNLIPINCKKK